MPAAASPADEPALVRRAQAGDATAYGELVGRHQAVVFRTALILLGRAADAEDAAQEAFVKAYLALPRFRADEPLRPWLLRIVANEARNRRRARGRGEHLLGRVLAAWRRDDVPSPEHAILDGEARAELSAAIGRLRQEDRLVVTCRYLLELSEAETAAALQVPAGTVKSRLHRALARLRAELGDGGTLAGAGS